MLYLALFLALLILALCIWQNKLPPWSMTELATGIVPEDPQTLADRHGVDLEVYSLARVGQSEQGMHGDAYKIAVMWATLNKAQSAGKTVTALVTAGNPKRKDYAQANGRYGRQGIHPYCTTIAEPTQHTIDLAKAVLDGVLEDPTGGARYYDDPLTQDLLNKANPYDENTGKGYRSAAEIAERRIASGLQLVTVDGVSTRFWK